MLNNIFNQNKIRNLLIIVVAMVILIVVFIFGFNKTDELKTIEQLAKNHPQGETLLLRAQDDIARISKDEKDLEAYLDLGIIKTQLGDLDGAEKTYLKSLSVTPRNIIVLNNLAFLYIQMKEIKKAEQAFLRLLEVTPSHYQTYIHLNDFYLSEMNDKKPAEEILLKGLEVLPEFPDLLSTLATFYRDQSQRVKAIEAFKRLLKVDPYNEMAKQELKRL